jgi:MtN3 and saliva related transmembrane protein
MGRPPTLKTMTLPASEWVGYLAGILCTLSFVPQAWMTLRTRDVSGISLGMYGLFTVGVALWLLYGVLLHAWPIVVANAVTLALAVAILAMKLVYGYRHPRAGGDDEMRA